MVQLEKEIQRRYCTIAVFTRVHARTGEQSDRNWLCYSKTRRRVYCFVCRLMSPTLSNLTSGFNDWKHAHKNSKQHLDVMAALCDKKSSSQIDSGLVKLYVVKFLCVRGLAFCGKN